VTLPTATRSQADEFGGGTSCRGIEEFDACTKGGFGLPQVEIGQLHSGGH